MIIVINGPLGIGKSTLAEALAERIHGCVMLDGDALLALNPEPVDAPAYLNGVLALLVAHHRQHGYRHVVINHYWRSPGELAALRRCLAADVDVRVLLLELPMEENLRRIARRAAARAIDEHAFELQTVTEERAALAAWPPGTLGTPFVVDAPPDVLVNRLLEQLGLTDG